MRPASLRHWCPVQTDFCNAKETNTKYSDIDIAYKLDYDKFSKKYIGGFSKILRINEIKDELKAIFKTEVDFVSDSNKKIMKDLIYV